MRCWWCGVEPDAVHDITTLSDPEPRYLPTWPPGGDHDHAEREPTPGQMEQIGHEALMRIRGATL